MPRTYPLSAFFRVTTHGLFDVVVDGWVWKSSCVAYCRTSTHPVLQYTVLQYGSTVCICHSVTLIIPWRSSHRAGPVCILGDGELGGVWYGSAVMYLDHQGTLLAPESAANTAITYAYRMYYVCIMYGILFHVLPY